MRKVENWIYIFLVVIASFLMIDRLLLPCTAIIGVIFGLLFVRDFKLNTAKLCLSLILITLTAVLTLTLSAVPEFSKLVDQGESVKELLRVVIYVMVLQAITRLDLDIQFHKTVWKVITLVAVVIVILQYTKLVDMNQLLALFYGASKQFVYAESNDLSTFRGGSVFVNPNVFACFLVAILANYLFAIRYSKESLVSKIIMFSLLLTGFVLAGSRTGLILAVLLILYHVYTTSQMGLLAFGRTVFLVVAMLAVVVIVLRVFFSIDVLDISTLRMFQVEDGLDDSFSTKVGRVQKLLSNMNFANVLVGYGAYDYAQNTAYMVDFDLGYFITFFGLVGLLAYFQLLYGFYRWGDCTLPGRRTLNTTLLLITIVFGMTAGIYFNLRIFTVYLLMFMPSLKDMKTQQRLA